MPVKYCRKCGKVLVEDVNWSKSRGKKSDYICYTCATKLNRAWRVANPEKHKTIQTQGRRRNGIRCYKENQECALFLGIYVAEYVLAEVFKDVKQMPFGNRGFDFICNHGKMVDVKSACAQHRPTRSTQWTFAINNNKIPDHFLCLAFDNRKDLNPLHLWLIPGVVVNHLITASISTTTTNKWDKYRIDIAKVVKCCDVLKNG